jgi:DNA-binding beta-propeller fold protein YncE
VAGFRVFNDAPTPKDSARLRRNRASFIFVGVLMMTLLWRPGLGTASGRDDDDDRKSDNSAELPTGMRITPTAARGARFSSLNPDLPGRPDFTAGYAVTSAASPDGRTLLILTSGYNLNYDAQGRLAPQASNEYVFVYDVSVDPPKKLQVLPIARAFAGLAWSPNGDEFYVSGGEEDTVRVFARESSRWKEAPPIPLGHAAGLGLNIKPGVAGLGVNETGTRLVVANYENDSISILDLAAREKIAELDLRPGKGDGGQKGVAGGEYPFWVVVKGNDKAYVSSIRDRQIVVVALGSEESVLRVTSRIPVRGSPNKMTLNKTGSRLYVACDNSDSVAIVDTATDTLLTQFSVTAPTAVLANPRRGFRGSNPNGLALAPDERTLYVTDGGTNALAVVGLDADRGAVTGLIPTGWYPNSVSASNDGRHLYVVNGKSPTGPNPRGCRNTTSVQRDALAGCRSANQYDLQLIRAGFLVLPVPQAGELRTLTERVASNDHFHATGKHEKLVTHDLREKIHHIIYIVKENRSYDQVLGDLERGNGDPSLASLPERISPNHHQLARQFVTMDNFYDSGEVSGDGWNWSTAAGATDSVEKTLPIQYADHGLDYAYEGANRNINVGIATKAGRRAADPYTPDDDDLLPGTADVSAPDGPGGDDDEAGTGYLWEDALRATLSVRNYGFFLDLLRYGLPPDNPNLLPLLRDPRSTGTVVAYPTKAALAPITDPYFRGFDQALPDYWRYKEWEHEFDAYVRDGNLPALELVRLAHDHFGDFGRATDGVNSVDTEMADNDYALGPLVEKVAHSRYKNDTLIFVLEDDSQDGPDHMDAHRSVAFVAGPYVRQQALVTNRYTTVNVLRTIEDILGIEPLGLNDGTADAMARVFERTLRPWNYKALVPAVLRTTDLPLPAAAAGIAPRSAAYLLPRRDAVYWENKTKGMDFSVEDRLDTPRFNRILWYGLMGEATTYPEKRDSRNLRRNRRTLLDRTAVAGPANSASGVLAPASK